MRSLVRVDLGCLLITVLTAACDTSSEASSELPESLSRSLLLSKVSVVGPGCSFVEDIDGSIDGRLDLQRTDEGYRAAAATAWNSSAKLSVEVRPDVVVLSGRVEGAYHSAGPGNYFTDWWSELRLPRFSDGTLTGVVQARGARSCTNGGDVTRSADIIAEGSLGPDTTRPEVRLTLGGISNVWPRHPPWDPIYVSFSEPVEIEAWRDSSSITTVATSAEPASSVDTFWDVHKLQQETAWNGIHSAILRFSSWSQVNGRDVALSFAGPLDPSANAGSATTEQMEILDVGSAESFHDFESGLVVATSGDIHRDVGAAGSLCEAGSCLVGTPFSGGTAVCPVGLAAVAGRLKPEGKTHLVLRRRAWVSPVQNGVNLMNVDVYFPDGGNFPGSDYIEADALSPDDSPTAPEELTTGWVDVEIEIPGADAYGEVGFMLFMARNAETCSSYGPTAFREVIAIERIGFAD